ncbi:MAG: Lrp/AsnC ligand binding domain-containing protein [Bacteroidales bacterium]|nr:Lrp/AsnC ligand binding domain-containing protein [Bacteroidales bacterium]
MEYQVDDTDKRILSYLTKDARVPLTEIAKGANISAAAVNQRIKKLKEAGVITGSRMEVKPAALGLTVCAFISVSLSEDNKYAEVVAALKHVPEVVECHFVTGRAALLIKVFCFSNEHLMDVLLNTIQRIPYISSTETLLSLDEAFSRQVWVKGSNPATPLSSSPATGSLLR